MVQIVNASSLTLKTALKQLQLDQKFENDFNDFLTLPSLIKDQRDRMDEIRKGWGYVASGKVSEGQVGFLAVSPLLWASGYSSEPDLKIDLEKNIEEIVIDDNDTVIRGRMDIIVSQEWEGHRSPLCILIVEGKNNTIDVAIGIPQLLTYATSFLTCQESIWGLATNGSKYQFIRVEVGLYREFPLLKLMRSEEAEEIMKVVIAIRKDFHENQSEAKDKK
ncbi:MAG: hypothetical protein ACFCBU_05200 [Cyanophyceae cyanobacterium]